MQNKSRPRYANKETVITCKTIIRKTCRIRSKFICKSIQFVKFLNAGITGKFPKSLTYLLTSGNGTALFKDEEHQQIRPLTVGIVTSRLIGKFLMSKAREDMKSYFEPTQLGVGTRNGAEAIVHAANFLLESQYLNEEIALLAIDFKNAFNNINRQIMLDECLIHFPKLYNWMAYCYENDSEIYYRDNVFYAAKEPSKATH
jgi:hypothetical protein